MNTACDDSYKGHGPVESEKIFTIIEKCPHLLKVDPSIPGVCDRSFKDTKSHVHLKNKQTSPVYRCVFIQMNNGVLFILAQLEIPAYFINFNTFELLTN